MLPIIPMDILPINYIHFVYMPVYNIALSTSASMAEPYGNLIKPISASNLANVSWLVNWEGLFGQDIMRYKKCVLRYNLISESNGTLTNNANLGFLVATGISTDKQAANFPGTLLGFLQPSAAIGTTQYCFSLNNLADYHGVQINMPAGMSEVAIRFYNDSDFTFQANVPHYILQLQFHLFNDE